MFEEVKNLEGDQIWVFKEAFMAGREMAKKIWENEND